LTKNVLVMTAKQDQALGYALDARWFGTPDFVEYMRDGLSKLTLDQVNAAIRKHLKPESFRVVMVAKDANALRATLLKDAPSAITYDSPKPEELIAEDGRIGATKLNISNVTITPVEQVFAR
jgi:zinc protease